MKRAVVGSLLVVCFLSAGAQRASQLAFREEVHNFGSVDENKGPVTHEFVFTNNSSRDVRILKVQASCGCTTPGWSRDPIPPGQQGFVQVSYNPKGRPGYFNRSLTVTTDLEPNPIVLQIKGQVSNVDNPEPSDFPIAKGNLRFRTSSFNMGRVFRKSEYAVREFPVLNAGDKVINFSGECVQPGYILVDVQPRTLEPGRQGTIRVSYNGGVRNAYGFQSDNIEVHTDDPLAPVKSFPVFATLEDYFPEMTAAELASAPQLVLGTQLLEFGSIGSNGTTEREVTITNAGRRPLELRAIQPNCTCITASVSKTTLKPGESAPVRISFNPASRKGTQTKSISFYSNDPKNPVQRLTFTAYVQ